MEPELTYYELLDVNHDASVDDIRAAFIRMAMQYHVDRAGPAPEAEREEREERMKELNIAKEVLTDANKRARYDAGLRSDEDEQLSGQTTTSDVPEDRPPIPSLIPSKIQWQFCRGAELAPVTLRLVNSGGFGNSISFERRTGAFWEVSHVSSHDYDLLNFEIKPIEVALDAGRHVDTLRVYVDGVAATSELIAYVDASMRAPRRADAPLEFDGASTIPSRPSSFDAIQATITAGLLICLSLASSYGVLRLEAKSSQTWTNGLMLIALAIVCGLAGLAGLASILVATLFWWRYLSESVTSRWRGHRYR